MTKTCQTIALFFICFFVIRPLHAIELQFPVACKPMVNCWITNHVDLLGTDNNRREDYMCGQKVTNNNKSTHISLQSRSAHHHNIPVIAAADGIVKTARYKGGFCGMRVAIDHKGGWETSYCHLKPDPFFVREGQEVKQGQVLGAIGMSGQTTWPHLSFAVIRNGMIFDPFSGRSNIEGCGATSTPLWISKINPLYEPAHVTSIGFTVGYPNQNTILNGLEPENIINADTRQIALWGIMMNILKGDEIHLKIIAPSGRILKESQITAELDSRYRPIYLNIRQRHLLFDEGPHRGEITITRNVHGNKITTGKFTTTLLKRDE